MKLKIIISLIAALAFIATFSIFVFDATPFRQVSHSIAPQYLNDFIIKVSEQYPDDGTHQAITGKEVNNTFGVTKDIYYAGQRQIIGDSKQRCYCIGLMFEVYLSACEAYKYDKSGSRDFVLPGIDLSNFKQIRRDFYGVNGNSKTFVDALAIRNLGREIKNLDDARPGDMVQFWRHNNIGHSVIFLGWVKDDNNGFKKIKYWSVQTKSGISANEEIIGDYKNAVDIKRIYIVRPFAPL